MSDIKNPSNPREDRLLSAYRTADRRAKHAALLFIEMLAREHPAPPVLSVAASNPAPQQPKRKRKPTVLQLV